MGNLQSKLKKNLKELLSLFKGRRNVNMAILGLDNSGKTTLVNLFKATNPEANTETTPTLGFNVEEITIGNTKIRMWDVGGQREFIKYWKDYVCNIDGLIFMVDVTDDSRFDASFEGFMGLVPHLKDGLPVGLLLNKKDILRKDVEVLNMNVSCIKKTFCLTGAKDTELTMSVGGKYFRVWLETISVGEDGKRMKKMQEDWSIQDSSAYTAISWIIGEIKGRDKPSVPVH